MLKNVEEYGKLPNIEEMKMNKKILTFNFIHHR